MCLIMAPLVIEVSRGLERSPIPYLLAVAMASNVGSTATITGNPQNMIIGGISHIPYGTFASALAPVAAVGVVLTIVLVVVLNRDQFPRSVRFTPKTAQARIHGAQMLKAVVVTLAVIGLFFAGMPVAQAALLGGALLLITRQSRPVKSTSRSMARS